MDTANAKMDRGITLQQTTSDNEILTLKSSDVSHGATGGGEGTEADTYGNFKKYCGGTGGLWIQGFRETGATAHGIMLNGVLTDAAHTTKGTGNTGVVTIKAQVQCSTSPSCVGSDGNLVAFMNHNTTRFIFDAEGSGHADVEFTTYDDHCDIELLRGVHGALVPCYTKEFGQDMMYNLCSYEDMGLIGKDSVHWEDRSDGRHQLRGMVNFTSLAMLHHSTIIQMADRFSTRLDSLETQLKALQGGCP